MDSYLRSINPILEACSPVFCLLQRIQEEPLPVNDRLFQQILTALDLMKERAQASHISSVDITKIKFVMVVFCDEMILTTKLSGNAKERRHSLQYTLLEIDNGSELFFDKLDKLLKTSKYNINLLELYYLCLELGFQGDKLDQAQQHHYYIKEQAQLLIDIVAEGVK